LHDGVLIFDVYENSWSKAERVSIYGSFLLESPSDILVLESFDEFKAMTTYKLP